MVLKYAIKLLKCEAVIYMKCRTHVLVAQPPRAVNGTVRCCVEQNHEYIFLECSLCFAVLCMTKSYDHNLNRSLTFVIAGEAMAVVAHGTNI